jgi:thiol-disulfide isomerase/thioredoxin
MLGGVVLVIGVIYMLTTMRMSHPVAEGFEETGAPLDWDHDNEVMVVFHKMKGCPHCDDFQAVWDEVYKIAPGEVRSKKNKTCKMVIVPPGHPIEKTSAPVNGFPTLRIYKTPADYVEFNGHRTKEEVVDFILANA